jgi:hypothetical protein
MAIENMTQEQALERIRNYKYNAFDGEQIVNDLLTYPELWENVWMNWNDDLGYLADTLTIQTSSRDNASRLIELGQEWASDGGLEAAEHNDGTWTVGGWWD